MKDFYIITYKQKNRKTVELFKESASKKDVNVFEISPLDFDFAANMNTSKDDLVYCASDDNKALLIEKHFVNNNATSLYSAPLNCIMKKTDNDLKEASLIHQKNKLPIIKSILDITNNKKFLKGYAEYLDGFPLIIKAEGRSQGKGIIRIDSYESFISVMDYLNSTNETLILRKYINYKEHGRLIVLGNEVISSVEYKNLQNDFRSNAGSKIQIQSKNFGSDVNKIATKAVNSLGFEFGGVDILIDKEGNPHIAEVNFPCNFEKSQTINGIDIASKIIDHLLMKSNKQ